MGETAATVLDMFRARHREARDLLGQVDPADLHTPVPGPETNSIAVLLHHALGAEAQILRQVAGVPAPRDREAEFRITPDRVDCAALLDELAPRISSERLRAPVERSGGRIMSGLRWLISAHGHFCDQLGEAQLTRRWLAGRPATR